MTSDKALDLHQYPVRLASSAFPKGAPRESIRASLSRSEGAGYSLSVRLRLS